MVLRAQPRGTLASRFSFILRFALNGRDLCFPPTGDTEAIKNYPRGVGAIQCVEVNAGNVVIQKIVTLVQSEVNTDPPDHFGIILASL
jgi:hypothetical protein